MKRLVSLYRSPRYSPLQHRSNDAAILEATTAELSRQGWRVTEVTEAEVEGGRLPAAELYLNMCQGPRASERLMEAHADGSRVVNRPSSVLNCHRRRLVEALQGRGVPFPMTVMTSTSPASVSEIPLDLLSADHDPIWVKRGDVHAERPEDVVVTNRDGITEALAGFAQRGIELAALQANVPGPILKFYAVADGSFFRWYPAVGGSAQVQVDVDRLRTVAFDAAAVLGLEIFGGDVAVPAPERPVLIDINDWPSFARFRQDAAQAIAAYIHNKAVGDIA